MADNVAITAGSGTTVAADEVVDGTLGTVKVQYLKIMDGTLDGTTKAAVGANGLAVDVKALPALPTGANVIGALTANQSINNAQFNGVTPLMGNGVTGTGSLRVTIASDNTAYSVNAVQSGTWNIGTVTTLTGITNALPAGTNLLGKTGMDPTTPGSTNGVVPNAAAGAGGITTTARLASAAATTNATNVKTTVGRIYSVSGKNNAAYDVFLVLYDSAANPPVPGTTTIRKKIICPAGAAFVYDWDVGLSFATGIGYAFTKLVADSDTTALVAADVTAFNMDYV